MAYQSKRDIEQIQYNLNGKKEINSNLQVQAEIIDSRSNIFEQLHGYKVSFFVTPSMPFNTSLEEIATNKRIKFMSNSKF